MSRRNAENIATPSPLRPRPKAQNTKSRLDDPTCGAAQGQQQQIEILKKQLEVQQQRLELMRRDLKAQQGQLEQMRSDLDWFRITQPYPPLGTPVPCLGKSRC